MLFKVLQFLINLVLYEFHRVPFRLGAPQVADQLTHSLWSQLTVPLALQQRDHWVRVLQLQSPTHHIADLFDLMVYRLSHLFVVGAGLLQ